jgi:aspartate/methionine/tyrosine aminotransferase
MLTARPLVRDLEASKIREVSVAGAGIEGVLPLWFGEPDIVTPQFIRDAAAQSLMAGETFYNDNLGILPLREAILRYHQRNGRRAESVNRLCVTASGVNALMLACQAVLDPGDRVAVLAPVWPNIAAIPEVLGATVERVPLHLAQGQGGGGLWRLDMDRLLAAIRPELKLLILNSPANPTGACLSRQELTLVLEACRASGTWILADEVYERIYFEGPVAPSLLDIATPEDRVLVVNSFSKSWAMTGWRLGWIVAPPGVVDGLAKLSEYNTSCTPVFTQRAGIAALEGGDGFIAEQQARYRDLRDMAAAALNAVPGVTCPVPEGAMYSFFKVEGLTDSLAEAKRMLVEAKVGIAPGSAFGPEGEGHFRLCFAQQKPTLEAALDRVCGFLRRG